MDNKNITKARAGLILDHPFFASILLSMPFEEDSSIETISTDGESIRYNPKWTDTLTPKEITFVLAHETLHCIFDHMGRRGDRGPNRWNQAADYVINDMLVKDKIGVMPRSGLINADLVRRGNYTAEGVYKLLPEQDEQKQPGQAGGSLDQVHDAGSNQGKEKPDQATLNEKSALMKVKVLQARNAAKMAGKMPASIERLVADLVKPKVDWRSELRRFISDRAKVDLTFARPKRRFLAEDLYLPSLSGQKMGFLVVAVDVSGSVDKNLLDRFAAEINAVREDVAPSRIEVIYVDTKVQRVESFGPDDDFKLKATGGGCTDFAPAFKHVANLPEQPVAVIYLTDLYCHSFGQAPSCPVLWCVLEGDGLGMKVPFGEILRIDPKWAGY